MNSEQCSRGASEAKSYSHAIGNGTGYARLDSIPYSYCLKAGCGEQSHCYKRTASSTSLRCTAPTSFSTQVRVLLLFQFAPPPLLILLLRCCFFGSSAAGLCRTRTGSRYGCALARAERGHCAQVEPQVGGGERRADPVDARHSVRPEPRARHLQPRAAQRRHCTSSTPAIPPGKYTIN